MAAIFEYEIDNVLEHKLAQMIIEKGIKSVMGIVENAPKDFGKFNRYFEKFFGDDVDVDELVEYPSYQLFEEFISVSDRLISSLGPYEIDETLLTIENDRWRKRQETENKQ